MISVSIIGRIIPLPSNVRNWAKADVDETGVFREARGMFAVSPKARADLNAGTLYAVLGEGGWLYYGQVTAEKSVGFFQRRDRQIADAQSVLSSPVMAVVFVGFPSMTRALRAGRWHKLGHYDLAEALRSPPPMVDWPIDTLSVSVRSGAKIIRETRVEDPAIQDLELTAVWDAERHVPARLIADFGEEAPAWHIGGPIWRERKVKEEMARRAPDQPWHQLPADWVSTEAP